MSDSLAVVILNPDAPNWSPPISTVRRVMVATGATLVEVVDGTGRTLLSLMLVSPGQPVRRVHYHIAMATPDAPLPPIFGNLVLFAQVLDLYCMPTPPAIPGFPPLRPFP